MMDGHRLASCGQPMQLAFVPRDIGKALAYWTGVMGAGPFFHLPHISLENTLYRGAPTAPDFSLWLGYWGDMQIELIAQHNKAPSIYLDAQDDHRLHHICILVDDFAAALQAVEKLEPLQSADVPGGGAVLYAQPAVGPIIEILKPAPGTEALFAMMRAAQHGWDGQDPVRPL